MQSSDHISWRLAQRNSKKTNKVWRLSHPYVCIHLFSVLPLGRLPPVQHAFSYWIQHIFIVIHWTKIHSSLKNNVNMQYPVWKYLPIFSCRIYSLNFFQEPNNWNLNFRCNCGIEPILHTAARHEFKSCLQRIGLEYWFNGSGHSYSMTKESGLYSPVAPNFLGHISWRSVRKNSKKPVKV